MPIKQTTYICDVCGEKFTSRKAYESHTCELQEPVYLVELEDVPWCKSQKVRVVQGSLVRRRGKLMMLDSIVGVASMEVSIDSSLEDVFSEIFLSRYEELTSRYDLDSVGMFDRFAVLIKNPEDLADAVEKIYALLEKVLERSARDWEWKMEDLFKKDLALQSQVQRMNSLLDENMDEVVHLADQGREPWFRTNAEEWDRIPYEDPESKSNGCIFVKSSKPRPAVVSEPFKDEDWFLMRIHLNWADEIDLECSEVVCGRERRLLAERAARAESCLIQFGTNESEEIEDVMSCLEFQEISGEDQETLERLGMLSVGKIGYLQIWEGLHGGELDEEEERMVIERYKLRRPRS